MPYLYLMSRFWSGGGGDGGSGGVESGMGSEEGLAVVWQTSQ